MGASAVYTLLFVGNVALFFLWVNYILKALKGECPHCGK